MSSHFAFHDLLKLLKKRQGPHLYSCPHTCEAAFQSLSSLAQQYVLRMLHVDHAMTTALLAKWADPKEESQANFWAQKELIKMKILEKAKSGVPTLGAQTAVTGDVSETPAEPGSVAVALQPEFRAQLARALARMHGQPWHEARERMAADPDPPTRERINSDAQEKWDSVLHYLVGSKAAKAPTAVVKRLLVKTGLMKEVVGGSSTSAPTVAALSHAGAGAGAGAGYVHDATVAVHTHAAMAASARPHPISAKGYEFMLKETTYQLWTFMQQYIESSDHPVEVAQFLFKLSFCSVGVALPVAALTETQRRLLPDLASFGLIWMSPGKSSWFYPSSLAASLTMAPKHVASTPEAVNRSAVPLAAPATDGASSAGMSSMQIIVEKNFKVYVYTSSALAVSLVGLFVDMQRYDLTHPANASGRSKTSSDYQPPIPFKLPNLAAGMLTRESVHRALRKGITAEQIHQFLVQRAHPLAIANAPVVPDNVVDQLHLWEMERKRVSHQAAVLLSDFDDDATFRDVAKYARDLVVETGPAKGDSVLLAVNIADRLLVIRPGGRDRVKAYIADITASVGGGHGYTGGGAL